jgi:hypothetical protein
MRDKRFIAEHRGGPLKKEHHRQLIKWACDCVEHAVLHFSEIPDKRLIDALCTAKNWQLGNASVGDARSASMNAISVARESSEPSEIYLARAVGHAAASAHMADHSIRAAEYALKTVKAKGKSPEEERIWQNEIIPSEIRELVLSARKDFILK